MLERNGLQKICSAYFSQLLCVDWNDLFHSVLMSDSYVRLTLYIE